MDTASECAFAVNHQPAQVYTFSQSDQQNILDFIPAPYHGSGNIIAVDSQPPQQYTFNQQEQESIIDITEKVFSAYENLRGAEEIFYRIMDDCRQAGVSLPPHNVYTTSMSTDANTAKWLAEETMLYQTRVLNNLYNTGPGQSSNVPAATNSVNHDQALHKFFCCLYELCPEPSRINIIKLVLFAIFFRADKRVGTPQPLSSVLPLARVWHLYTIGDKHKGYRILQILAKDMLTGFFVPFCTRRGYTQTLLHYRTLATPLSRTGACRDNARRCFKRDGARCVITGKYHRDWALGRPQQRSIYGLAETDIAYIIPHTLNDVEPDGSISRANNFIWRMMNMLDRGISSQLSAYKITTPMNALLMDKALCDSFTKLQWYLQEVPGTVNTYTMHTFARYRLNIKLPFNHVTFTNHEDPTTTTPSGLPCPRLLRFHRLCCLILNTSGAAQFVEHAILKNGRLMEQDVFSADG